MAASTADTYQDVLEAVRAFNEGLEEGKGLEAQLSYFRAWYYIPELDAIGPSKFIGYKGMTATEYLRSKVLDGRVTEPVLSRWFETLPEQTADAEHVATRVAHLLQRYRKKPNRMVRYSAPRGWTLGQGDPPQMHRNEVSASSGARPIVDVFWRAFLSLYPEDQDALVEHMIEFKRHR